MKKNYVNLDTGMFHNCAGYKVPGIGFEPTHGFPVMEELLRPNSEIVNLGYG